jgi:branched-chain amino acid transport system substrate-binding protein
MSSSQAEVSLILKEFTEVSLKKNKQYNSQELFQHILTWTEGNPQLTFKLCQYVLRYSGNIASGKESVFIEQLFTNYLLKEPKLKKLPIDLREKIYRQQFTKASRKHQGIIPATLRFDLTVIRQNLGFSPQKAEQLEKSASGFLIKHNSKSNTLEKQQVDSIPDQKLAIIPQEVNLGKDKPERANFLKKRSLLLLLICLLGIGFGFWFKKNIFANNIIRKERLQANKLCLTIKQQANDRRVSLGEKILSSDYTEFSNNQFTQAVTEGINAFANCSFEQAVAYFDKSLKIQPNNPEIVIYLNNTRTATQPNLRIAVSVPINSNDAIAKEILRGVAQAQTEINREGGINGKMLSVEITNDDNKPEIAGEIAAKLVQQPAILAVVGHGSSDTSAVASEIYQQGKLVTIIPTSAAMELSGIGNYIFRTVPNVRALADSLGYYTVKAAKKNKIAFCVDASSTISQSFLKEFIQVIQKYQGQIIDLNCDFSVANFNPDRISFSQLSQQAEALLLVPSIDTISQAIAVAKANQNQLPLLSSHTLYVYETIQKGQANVNEMILPVPWQSGSIPRSSFPQTARQMWGGDVNWRTAMAYDATVVIIQGLKESASRKGLQAALSDRRFAVNGATGEFRFENGDREGKVLLVKIYNKKSDRGNNYQFLPIKPTKQD